MNKPTASILREFSRIASNRTDLSLNWCEKRNAWGILQYSFSTGSAWHSFMLFDRKRK